MRAFAYYLVFTELGEAGADTTWTEKTMSEWEEILDVLLHRRTPEP